MAVGLKQIAKDLNLGVSTVAFALAGNGTLGAETRRRVLEHAEKVGYMPNLHARRIRSSRTGMVGLIIPDLMFSPYVEVVHHLFHYAVEQHEELHISLTEFNGQLEDRAIKSMIAMRVDGIIAKLHFQKWEDVPEGHHLRVAREKGVPVVLYSGSLAGSGLPYMVHPLFASAAIVADHLIEMGHKRLACVVPASQPFSPHLRRWVEAVQARAAAARGVGVQPIGLEPLESDDAGPPGEFRNYINQRSPEVAVGVGRVLFRKAMKASPKPTALVCFNDTVAVGCVLEALSTGVRPGQDVAIAGCQLQPTTFFSPVSLTTADHRPKLFAEKLLHLLRRHQGLADRDTAPLSDAVEPLLVVGNSTVGG